MQLSYNTRYKNYTLKYHNDKEGEILFNALYSIYLEEKRPDPIYIANYSVRHWGYILKKWKKDNELYINNSIGDIIDRIIDLQEEFSEVKYIIDTSYNLTAFFEYANTLRYNKNIRCIGCKNKFCIPNSYPNNYDSYTTTIRPRYVNKYGKYVPLNRILKSNTYLCNQCFQAYKIAPINKEEQLKLVKNAIQSKYRLAKL